MNSSFSLSAKFLFSLDEGMYLYGVFDGHDGSRASNFTAQRMPAEILLGQIGSTTEDSEVQEVLRQVGTKG